MTTLTATKQRISSIDILRGIVMVIMALDHTRDFLYSAPLSNAGSAALDPTNMNTTTPMLFFTRWITHFCAPTFVFLAGVSAYLIGLKRSKPELSTFLIKRGIWLVLVELFIITLGWTYNPFYNLFILQVIWAIGVSMILLGLIVQLPYQLIFAFGFIIVFGHNLLDYPSIGDPLKGSWWSNLLYFSNFNVYQPIHDHFVIIVYAFLPWLGVMILGYCFGKIYAPAFDAIKRRKILIQLGFGLIALFIILRLINNYGDPVHWATQPRGGVYSFLSFMNVNKYPPSLDFLSITIGPAMLMLAYLEGMKNRITDFFNIYGRVPMFYYILHFFILHTILVIVFYAQGFTSANINTPGVPFRFKPNGVGFGLAGVYAVWLFTFLVLYPLCKKYDRYKSTHQHWWLSYL